MSNNQQEKMARGTDLVDNFFAMIPIGSIMLRMKYYPENTRNVIDAMIKKNPETPVDKLRSEADTDNARRFLIGGLGDLIKFTVLIAPMSMSEDLPILTGAIGVAAVAIVGQLQERLIGEFSGLRFD